MEREGAAPTLITIDGRVAILGTQPLLESRISGGQRQLVIYGKVGTNYTVQSRTSLAPPATWANRSTVAMTNNVRVIAAPAGPGSLIFYQLRQ
jgi:hypothetical protein